MMTFEPTGAEQKLIAAVREGRVADYSSGDPGQDDPTAGRAWHDDRTIRSEIICQLPTSSNPGWEVHPKGIDVRGARIIGQFYLGGATLKSRLALIRCCVEECLNLADAIAFSIALTGSYIDGMQAERLTVHGSIFLDAVTARTEVKLLGATISGQLKCREGVFTAPMASRLARMARRLAEAFFLTAASRRRVKLG